MSLRDHLPLLAFAPLLTAIAMAIAGGCGGADLKFPGGEGTPTATATAPGAATQTPTPSRTP